MSVSQKFTISVVPNKITLPVAPKNQVAGCSKSRCPLLKIPLPVGVIFVARRYKFCCPWFSKTTGNEIYADHHGFSRRRPSPFAAFAERIAPSLGVSDESCYICPHVTNKVKLSIGICWT